jgi:hypothetical protein
VADARAHFARAKSTGAEIVFDVEDQANGGRSYSCRDPEGHLWNFGTYNPWRTQAVAHLHHDRRGKKFAGHLQHVAVAIAVSVSIAIIAAGKMPVVVQDVLHDLTSKAITTSRPAGDDASIAAGSGTALEDGLNAVRQQLIRAVNEKVDAERSAVEVRKQLTQALVDKQAAELNAKEMQDRLARAWIGRNVAERVAKSARQQLARERSARKTAESAQLPLQQLPPVPRWQ